MKGSWLTFLVVFLDLVLPEVVLGLDGAVSSKKVLALLMVAIQAP